MQIFLFWFLLMLIFQYCNSWWFSYMLIVVCLYRSKCDFFVFFFFMSNVKCFTILKICRRIIFCFWLALNFFVDSNAYWLDFRMLFQHVQEAISTDFLIKKKNPSSIIGYAQNFCLVSGWIEGPDLNSGWCKCLSVEHTVIGSKLMFLVLFI